MRTHIRLLAVLVVSGVTTLLVVAPATSAGPAPKTDVEKVRGFLGQIVSVVKDDREAVENNVSVLNDMNKKVNEVVANVSANDPETAQDAISAMSDYADAILKTEATARELGTAVTKADGVFKLDQDREADGTLPEGTLTPMHKDELKLGKSAFDNAEQAIKGGRDAYKKENTDLADKDIKVGPVPAPGESGAVGLVVTGGYLPHGKVTGTASGFAIIRNYDDKPHSGVFSIEIDKSSTAKATASVDNGGQVSVPGGGVQKVDFTIQIDTPGEVLYSGNLDWK